MTTSIETKNENPTFDRFTNECLTLPVSQWNPNIMAVFAHRIEDAFSEKFKGDMVAIQEELNALMRHVLASAPDSVHAALSHDDSGDVSVRAAYMLGCLSFAHQFASTVAHHRPEDEFFEAFNDELTKKVLVFLAQGARTKAELSDLAGLALATLNRLMSKLTGIGIVDFRTRFGNGEPGVAEYFLTPAAKQTLAEQART